MAIVGGFAFAAVRLAVAAWPWAAPAGLRQEGRGPGRAWRPSAGYLVLSGAPPPAERAAITAGGGLRRHPGRPAGDQPARPGAGGPGHPAPAARGGDRARASRCLSRPRRRWWPWPRPGRGRSRRSTRPGRSVSSRRAGGWTAASIAASFVAGPGHRALRHPALQPRRRPGACRPTSPVGADLVLPDDAGPGGGGGADAARAWARGRWRWPASASSHAEPRSPMRPPPAPARLVLVASAPAWALPTAFLGILLLCLWKGPLRWVGLPLALAVTAVPAAASAGRLGARRTGRRWPCATGRRGGAASRPDVKLFGAELRARPPGASIAEERRDRADRRYRLRPLELRAEAGAGRRSISAAWRPRPVPIDPAMVEALCRAVPRSWCLRGRGPTPARLPGCTAAADRRRTSRASLDAAELYRTPARRAGAGVLGRRTSAVDGGPLSTGRT